MRKTAAFLIEDVFCVVGKGVVATGIVKSGEISIGMWGNLEGSNLEGKRIRISSIETFNKTLTMVTVGQHCGLLLEGVTRKEEVKKGQVIYFE